MKCERCGRAITNPESQKLGIGPTCLERMMERGLVVGGKQKRPRVFTGMRQARVRPSDLQRDWVREIGA
jgi:hypothetical protein